MERTKKIGRILKRILLGIVIIAAAAAGLWAFMYFHRSDPSEIKQYETTNPFIYDSTQISAHRSGAGIFHTSPRKCGNRGVRPPSRTAA